MLAAYSCGGSFGLAGDGSPNSLLAFGTVKLRTTVVMRWCGRSSRLSTVRRLWVLS
jgi:hypothetical protein